MPEAKEAEPQPVICLMDDGQWLDRASVPALAFVDSHREAQSVGLLFAPWPGERARDRLAGEHAFRGTAIELGGAPAVPRHDRTIGPIRVAERLELFRSRRRHPHASPNPFPHPAIAGAPHVQAPQLKHEKHLRRLRADAPGTRKHRDDLVVALAARHSRIKHHRPVTHFHRQIPHGRRLAGAQAHSRSVCEESDKNRSGVTSPPSEAISHP